MTQAKETKVRRGNSNALYLFGLTLIVLVTVSCGQDFTPPELTPMVEQASPHAGNQTEGSVSPVNDVPAPASAIPSLPAYDIESLISRSDLIARIRLVGVEPVYWQDGDMHYAELEYELEVLEYLKGGRGSDRIWGIVSLPSAAGTDEQEVRAVAVQQLNERETRWDAGEAIIFMRDSAPGAPSTHEDDRYFLGWFTGGIHGSSLVKATRWLPLVPESRRKGGEEQYIFDHPDVESQRRAYRASLIKRGPTPEPGLSRNPLIPDGPLISLSQLTGLIADDESGLLNVRIEAASTARWKWDTEPRNLRVSAKDDSVTLTWDEPRFSALIFGYKIFRRQADVSEFTLLAELEANAEEMSYEDLIDLVLGTTYVYQVLTQAPNYGEGGGAVNGHSAEIAITTPPAP